MAYPLRNVSGKRRDGQKTHLAQEEPKGANHEISKLCKHIGDPQRHDFKGFEFAVPDR